VWDLALRLVLALWHVVGLLLVLVLLIEFGTDGLRRAIIWLRHRRPTRPDRAARSDAYAGADWATPYFDEFRTAVRLEWRPFVEWWQLPLRGNYLTIDERGLRSTPGEHDAGPDALRIFCFGGSTMMGMGARDERTIPALLQHRLRQLGVTAAVTNMGQLGHNNMQETIALQLLLKNGDRPDIAVFYDGINEMVCAEQTGRPDGVIFDAPRRAEFNLLFADRRRDLIAAALISAMPRTVRRLREITGLRLRGPIPTRLRDTDSLAGVDISALARLVVEAYAANLRVVRLLADFYGFSPLFFWQPVITTKRIKSADELRWESDETGDVEKRRRLFAAIIEEYRRHPELAAAGDVVDLSALFDDRAEPVYIDFYHLSEAGNAAVAEAMLPAIISACSGRVSGTA